MLCPVWPLAMAVLCVLTVEVSAQCWESSRCQDLSTEENMLVSDTEGEEAGGDTPQLNLNLVYVRRWRSTTSGMESIEKLRGEYCGFCKGASV